MITHMTNDREPSFEPKKAKELGVEPRSVAGLVLILGLLKLDRGV